MVIHVRAVFVNDETNEEFPFADEDKMHSIAGIFIYHTLRKHFHNNALQIGLDNGICTVPVENTQENIDIIKNIYEDNGNRDHHPGYYRTPSHLRFYVVPMEDAGIDIELIKPLNYVCECGCKLEFIDYKPGLDINIGNKWLITQSAMEEYYWEDYLPIAYHETWLTLKTEIIKMYEEEVLIGTPHSAPWLHLYNYYVKVENDPFPLNARLSYEYVF